MLVKEAIYIICRKRGVFLVKKFVKNHKKYGFKQKYYCENHKKCHKYTFHSRIESIPGDVFFAGFDTAKEVINYAKGLKLN